MQPQQPRMPFMPSFRASAAVAVAVVALLAGAPVAAAQTGSAATGLVVQGTGTAYGTPDLAVLTLGVEVVEPQVQAALTQSDKTMSAVRSVFLTGGVDAKDIRTAAFNVWREDIRDRNGNVTGERYHVVQDYRVTVRDLGSVGSLLADAVQAGANNVQGIQFGLQDPAGVQKQARAQAMHDARSRAEQLAALAGVTLGRSVSIQESTSNPSPPVPMVRLQAAAAAAAPVEGGQLSVEVHVTVRYAMQ